MLLLETLGVDFGGVLVETNTPPAGNFWEVPPLSGAFKALRLLGEKRFGGRVYVVSHCSTFELEQKALKWLKYQNFYELTGLSRDNIRFCREIEQKADICKELGITHFVDDRLAVLSTLTAVGTIYYFQPNVQRDIVTQNDFNTYWDTMRRARAVHSWADILRELLLGSGVRTEAEPEPGLDFDCFRNEDEPVEDDGTTFSG